MASPLPPEDDMNTDAAWETNLKSVVDGYHQLGISTLSELVLSQQQIRRQQDTMFMAHADHVRNQNGISHLAQGSFKTIEDKLLDPDATEVASQALSAAQGLSGMNATNQQTMASIAQSLSTLTGLMEQMIARNGGSS